MNTSDIIIAVAAAAAILLMTSRSEAKPDKLVTTTENLAYCALYAREATRIDIMHTQPIDTRIANTNYLTLLATRVYRQCVDNLPALLPLPEEHRNMRTWAADMRALVISRSGTEPATGGSSSWAEACAEQYRTWDEATGTVVRRGSPERVRCPLVRGENGEWGVSGE